MIGFTDDYVSSCLGETTAATRVVTGGA